LPKNTPIKDYIEKFNKKLNEIQWDQIYQIS
jgi:hypothetical protein